MNKMIFIFSVISFPILASMANVIVPNAPKVTEQDVAIPGIDPQPLPVVPVQQDAVATTFINDKTDENAGDDDGMISINLDNPNDLNWKGVLESSDNPMHLSPIVLPFLNAYPIENLEIKFRLLKAKF